MTKTGGREHFKIEHNLVACEPDVLMASLTAGQIEIRAELVDHPGGVARRTGRYIHLGMTVADAMRLLSELKAVQQRLGLREPPATQVIAVPPAKDRQ